MGHVSPQFLYSMGVSKDYTRIDSLELGLAEPVADKQASKFSLIFRPFQHFRIKC